MSCGQPFFVILCVLFDCACDMDHESAANYLMISEFSFSWCVVSVLASPCVVCVHHLSLALYCSVTNHFCAIVIFEYPCYMDHGRRKGGAGEGQGTLDFEILHFSVTFSAKMGVFLVSRRKNEISPLLAPPWKHLYGYFWKNPLLAPTGKNPSDAHDMDQSCRHGGLWWV